jgi:lysyl endopeptidase
MKSNFIKYFLLILFIQFVSFSIVFSQISRKGNPKSSKVSLSDFKKVPVIDMPKSDFKELLRDDSIKESVGLKSVRFAKPFNVDIDVKKQGLMELLKDSSKVWRLGIKSIGAYSLNIIFSDYELPSDAELFIYNEDKKDLIGAFTNDNNNKSRSLATSPVQGDKVFIELFEPNKAVFSAHVKIGMVNHDYKNIYNLLNNKGTCCGYKQSGSCEIDINCSNGDSWQNEKNSVCRLIISGNSYCTGAVVNNTNNDGKYYVLTANHCYESYTDLVAAANNTIISIIMYART